VADYNEDIYNNNKECRVTFYEPIVGFNFLDLAFIS